MATELLLSFRGTDKVRYDKGFFYFFSNKKDCRSISVDKKHFLNLCNYVDILNELHDKKFVEMEYATETAPDEVLKQFTLCKEGDYEVGLELNVFKGVLYIWLKLYRYIKGKKNPCKGCVNLTNANGQSLKSFYYTSLGNPFDEKTPNPLEGNPTN